MPMIMAAEPSIVQREEQHYLGIRTTTPFRGMFAAVAALLKELRGWVKAEGIADQGPTCCAIT